MILRNKINEKIEWTSFQRILYLKLLVHVTEGEYALIELVHHFWLLVFIQHRVHFLNQAPHFKRNK